MAVGKWKAALQSIVEHLTKEQYDKMLLLLEDFPNGKTEVSREQMVQKIIEYYGEKKSIIMVNEIMKEIPRNDRAVQKLLQPFMGKKKRGKKRKPEADPEPEEGIPQEKSADGFKKNRVMEDCSGKNKDPDFLKSPQPDKVRTTSPWKKPIGELKSGVDLHNKTIVGKVVEKSGLRKYKTKDNEKKFFFYLGITDDSDCIKVMVYGKEKFSYFQKEECYTFRNVIMEQEVLKFTQRSRTSKAGKLDVPINLELKAQTLVYGQRPVVPIKEIQLLDQKNKVSAEGTVKEIWEVKSVKMKGKRTKKKNQELKLEDMTGSIIITLWGKDIQQLRDVSLGDFVRVTNVTTNRYYETVSLNSTDFTRIFKLQSTPLQNVEIEIIGIKRAGHQKTELDAAISEDVNTYIVESAVLAEALGIQQGSDFEDRLLEKIPYLAEAEIKGNTILKLTGMKE